MFYVYGSANIDATIFNGTSKKGVRFFLKFLSIYELRKILLRDVRFGISNERVASILWC